MMLRHLTVDGIIEFLRTKITNEIQNDPKLVNVIREADQEAKLFTFEEVAKISRGNVS